MSANDGGPAFPMPFYQDGKVSGAIGGMTLRDYFAAVYLGGAAASPNTTAGLNAVVAAAYKVADAMLQEREK